MRKYLVGLLMIGLFFMTSLSCKSTKMDAESAQVEVEDTEEIAVVEGIPEKEEVQKPKAPKEEVSKELVWHEYIDKAYKESQKSGKPIMANFTGSDWCGWCIRLDKEVFSKAEFKAWADENVVLLKLDYPKRTKLPEDLAIQNSQLQQVFKISGYPTIWFFDLSLNPENKQFDIAPLGKTGYVSGGTGPWITGANQILGQ